MDDKIPQLKEIVSIIQKGIESLQREPNSDIKPLDTFLSILKDEQIDEISNDIPTDSARNAYTKILETCLESWNTIIKDPNARVIRHLRTIIKLFIKNDVQQFIDKKDKVITISSQDGVALLKKYPSSLFDLVFQEMVQKEEIQFPYKRFFEAKPEIQFKNLKEYEPKIVHYYFTPQNCRFRSGKFYPFTFKGEYTVIEYQDSDYRDIDLITDHFQEQERMKAKRKDQTTSPYDWWKSSAVKLFRELLNNGVDINSHNLREEIYKKVKECTLFKPSLAKAVYKLLNGKKILDFSAGWGDRLIAALSLPAELYIGVDPNTNLKVGHSEIISNFTESPEDASHFKIIYEPFQTAELPANVTFDLIFTSPPFFDLEEYTKESGQSAADFPTYEDWLVKFLFVSLEKAWNVLEMNGYLAIHMTDIMRIWVCEPMNHFIQMSLRGSHYVGVLGATGSSGKILPIWVWQKLDKPNYKREEDARYYFEDHFRRVYDAYRRFKQKKRTSDNDENDVKKIQKQKE